MYLNIILIILMTYPVSSLLQGRVNESDYEFIGYAICGKYWESPCIGTLIHNRYLLTSAKCIKRGVCGVAGLRAHDMKKALPVRVIRQLLLRPKNWKSGHSSMTKNVGLLEILPPKLLDGTIPTVRLAKDNVLELLQNAKECESVRWNQYNKILEYVSLMEDENNGHFMTCDELVEEESLENEKDCRKTAIFKLSSESLPDTCLSQHGLPLFCQGYQVGIFVECRSLPSLFYENIKVNYIEFSLLQDQITWIEEIIKNDTAKGNSSYNVLPKQKMKMSRSNTKVFIKSILQKYVNFDKEKDQIDTILNDKAIFKIPSNAKKGIKIAVREREKILYGDIPENEMPSTKKYSGEETTLEETVEDQLSVQTVSTESSSFFSKNLTEEIRQTDVFSFDSTVLPSSKAGEKNFYRISKHVGKHKKSDLSEILEGVSKKISTNSIKAQKKRTTKQTSESTGKLEKKQRISKDVGIYKKSDLSEILERGTSKKIIGTIESSMEQFHERSQPLENYLDVENNFYEIETSSEIFDNRLSRDYLLEEESFANPQMVFPVKKNSRTYIYSKKRKKGLGLKKYWTRVPLTFKTIKPLKFREVDDLKDTYMAESRNSEVFVREQPKEKVEDTCDSFWHCSSSRIFLPSSKFLCLAYFILFLSQYIIIFL